MSPWLRAPPIYRPPQSVDRCTDDARTLPSWGEELPESMPRTVPPRRLVIPGADQLASIGGRLDPVN